VYIPTEKEVNSLIFESSSFWAFPIYCITLKRSLGPNFANQLNMEADETGTYKQKIRLLIKGGQIYTNIFELRRSISLDISGQIQNRI
jgi:hypothetical protein